MRYKRYARYKDSGVDWIGEVPEGWEVSRIKRLPRNEYRSFVDGDWIESPYITENGIRLIQTGNIGIGKYREQGYRYISEETFYKLNCTEIYPNDVLVCRLAEPVGRACLAPKLNEKMITSVDVCILRPKRCYDRRYIVYFLSFKGYLEEVSIVARGSTRQRISRTQLGNVECLVPPLTEQISIANFLDQKTAEIDSLIADKEKMVQLLQEMRQAIISEAVTKGLDKNVKMKDSGVEWIGEIPEHWEICTFRRFCNLQQGLQIAQSERFYAPGSNRYEYITIKSIHQGEDNKLKEYVENPSPRVICNEDDVLLARTGATGIVISGYTGVFHNNFFKINFDHRKIHMEYLVNYLSQPLIQHYLKTVAGTTTVPDLNHGDFLNTPSILPPLSEQKMIIVYIKKISSHIEMIIKRNEEQIEKLHEYRQSLISEAVTGKIDVRDFMQSTKGGVQNGCNAG